MFFILSKTVGLLLNPMVLLLMLLVLGLAVKKLVLKRLFLGLFVLFFLLFSNTYITNELLRWWETPPVTFAQLRGDYEAAIVLGGVTAPDKSPHDRVHLYQGADRILHAVQLYKLNRVKKIIVSGGSGRLEGDSISEAARMQQVLLLSGVKPKHVLLEEESRNTHENAVNVQVLLADKKKGKRYLLVTSAYHMPRALATFKKVGLPVVPFSTDLYSFDPPYGVSDYLIPSAVAVFAWEKLLREWFGLLTYKVVGYV